MANPGTKAKREETAAGKRVESLKPVSRTELEGIVTSRATIRVNIPVREDGKVEIRKCEGRLQTAQELYPGRAEGAPLHEMLYDGFCLLPGPTSEFSGRAITNIHSPEDARKSPLSPKVLRIYHGKKDGEYVLDMPVNDSSYPLPK